MYFIYRINGGEVQAATVDTSVAVGWQSIYFNFIQNPPTPNGVDLSIPKIYDGTNVRNATPIEITNFITARTTDNNLQDRQSALDLILSNPQTRKVLVSMVSVLVDEINLLREWLVSFQAQVALATTLADLKTRIATLSTMPDRTIAQAKTAVQTKINTGTFD